MNNLLPYDGELYLVRQFYPIDESDYLFNTFDTSKYHKSLIKMLTEAIFSIAHPNFEKN